jgi:ABC-type polysaccharide/polyol phosphate export permease
VIDNGCQDEIRELTERILPNARYVPERRPGLDFARNRALSEVTSEIIAFLDDDAVADAFWVRSIAECFASFPRAAAVTGLTLPLELETEAQELFEANGGFAPRFTRTILPGDGKRLFRFRLPLVVSTSDVGTGCNMAFRAIIIKQTRGFDENLGVGTQLPGGDENDMFYRVIRAGHDLISDPRALVRHRHRRTKAELLRQLAGHQKGFTSFLMKTLGAERGWSWVGVALFLAWRLIKPGFRMIRRLIGRDVLPLDFHLKLFLACLTGLGGYPASSWRSRGLAKKSGGRPAKLKGQLSELWLYRELMWTLTIRDLKVKYQRSLLGFLWTLLNPLVTVGLLIAVFSYVMRIPIEHYWAFLISGYFVFNFFAQTLNGGVQSAVGNAYLTRSAYFPQEALAISAALARLIEFLGELAIVLAVLAIFHHKGLPLSFLMVVPLVPILFLLAIGLSLPLVALAAYFDDTVQIIPLVTLVLFYISPVFYNVELVPERVRDIYLLNPLASLLELYHAALYLGEMPNLYALLGLGGVASAFALLGYAVFNWKKREFAEIV